MVTSDGNTAGFSHVALRFFGNDELVDQYPFIFPSSSEIVDTLPGPLEKTAAPFENPSFQPNDLVFTRDLEFTRFEVALRGDTLLIRGGRDARPVDGHGEDYNVVAYLVPEPSTRITILLVSMLTLARGRLHPRGRRKCQQGTGAE
jgi:hypothetical protein